MKKAIYIVRGTDDEDYPDFESRVFELAHRAGEQVNPEILKVTLTVKRPPLFSVIPFRRSKVAAISIGSAAPEGIDALTLAEGFDGRYLVEEAVPVSYEKTWSDGIMTPGACLLTLFNRRPGLDGATFLHRWHNGHTPLSLRLHPLWNYNRNVVKDAYDVQGRPFDGIVEEQFKSPSELLNPMRFFGPPHRMPLHMYQVYMDSRSFIDMKRIEVYLAAECCLRS